MIDEDLTQEKVNLETAQIAWSELQRFFASGLAVYISPEIDLVTVADAFTKDNKTQVTDWMQQQQIHLVSDQQAKQWIKDDIMVWATVVKPWILVQTL